MSKKLEIGIETADRIAVLVLRDQHQYLKKQLMQFEKGGYLHADDVVYNTRMIAALNLVIKHFGDD